MEFFEDESRPRFLFQARCAATSSSPAAASAEIPKFDKLHATACLSAAVALLLLAYLFLSGSETFSSLLVWVAFSLALAPFAPPSATGGDARVGRGDPLPSPSPSTSRVDPDEPRKRIQGRRPRSQKSDEPPPPPVVTTTLKSSISVGKKVPIFDTGGGSAKHDKLKEQGGENNWTDHDFELLKKQISKHPVGKPMRWEMIAEAFHGRHALDSVISTAKSLPERKPASGDPYQQFLKQRKPVDQRIMAADVEPEPPVVIPVENGDLTKDKDNGGGNGNWTAGEDISLLNALKAFPKDVPMRWEKIAAAVPGKSKASCMKRVAELKKNFRSSKATEE